MTDFEVIPSEAAFGHHTTRKYLTVGQMLINADAVPHPGMSTEDHEDDETIRVGC